MNTQPDLLGGSTWLEVRDGNPTGLALFRRHYSNRHGLEGPARFVGPGERLVLITPCAKALFVWRFERFHLDGQTGINCAVFRNEGAGGGQSSALIRAADAIADLRWPGERHYTYVDPRKVRSTNPGACFKFAGWRLCGISKRRKLVILERLPP